MRSADATFNSRAGSRSPTGINVDATVVATAISDGKKNQKTRNPRRTPAPRSKKAPFDSWSRKMDRHETKAVNFGILYGDHAMREHHKQVEKPLSKSSHRPKWTPKSATPPRNGSPPSVRSTTIPPDSGALSSTTASTNSEAFCSKNTGADRTRRNHSYGARNARGGASGNRRSAHLAIRLPTRIDETHDTRRGREETD